MRPQHEVLIAIIRPRNFKHFAQSLGKSLGVTREGAKFIGLHQGQPVRGGAKSFWEERNYGANTFSEEKHDGADTFLGNRNGGARTFLNDGVKTFYE